MLEPQVKSVPTTCPLGMVGGGPHTIATRRTKWHYMTFILHIYMNYAFHSPTTYLYITSRLD